MSPRAVCLAVFAFFAPLGRADEIDDLVRAEMMKSKAPAVAIAVVQDGKLVRAQAYGVANVEWNAPATTDTVFRVASMSKQFCAAAVLLLADEGKCQLTDSVRKWLPDAPESWQSITLHHLLTHTSGMPELGRADDFPFETTLDAAGFLKKLYAKPLRNPVGAKFEYSNSGYSVLGLIVGKISGTSLESVVRTRIFESVGMTRTRYYMPYEIVPNRAAGYERTGDGIQNTLFLRPPMMQGSGGVMATVTDFAKWDIALNSDRPLAQRLKDLMWKGYVDTKGEDRYGYGWYVEGGARKTVRHSGGTIGFSSNIVRFMDDRLTVIVFENISDGGAIALSRAIADTYLAPKREHPQFLVSSKPMFLPFSVAGTPLFIQTGIGAPFK